MSRMIIEISIAVDPAVADVLREHQSILMGEIEDTIACAAINYGFDDPVICSSAKFVVGVGGKL